MKRNRQEKKPFPREGGFLIARIFQVSGRVFARKMRERELTCITPEQGRILFALWRSDGIAIQELAGRTSLSKSTLTAMLDRLEEGGHIVRVPSPEDRRRILIRLTEKDKQLRDTYIRISDEMSDLVYRGFSDTEIETLEGQLRRILQNLEDAES
ncbi:MAG TPA: MarR family transcriptional regulator [Syntrophales bacterium]|jgi:DNA-binding MarR family transcriptional regulator|nr:MarR family transcriptional regulator [Syntrophales bacterium]